MKFSECIRRKMRGITASKPVLLVNAGKELRWGINRSWWITGRAPCRTMSGVVVEGFLLNRKKGLEMGSVPALPYPMVAYNGNSFMQFSLVATTRQANKEVEAGKQIETGKQIADDCLAMLNKLGKNKRRKSR